MKLVYSNIRFENGNIRTPNLFPLSIQKNCCTLNLGQAAPLIDSIRLFHQIFFVKKNTFLSLLRQAKR